MSRTSSRPDFGYIDDSERRRHPRRIVNMSAEISVGDNVECECTIIDISHGGAQLEIPTGYLIPDEFMLIPPSRLCRIAWRKEDRLGVAFQAEEPFSGA